MHFRTPGKRFLSGTLVLCAVALALASCGATTTNVTTASPSPTAMLAATATATTSAQANVAPTATPVSVVSQDAFTCPVMVDGSDKEIADPSILLIVAFPVSWNETHCTRAAFSDGSADLWIGNYVHITAEPDTDRTVQQYVTAHQTSYEKVALQPMTVRQAAEAFTLSDQLDQSAPSPADYYFSQVHAILRGSHYLYLLTTSLDVEYHDTSADTVPPGPVVNYISEWSAS